MPLHHVGTQILTTERLTLRRYTEDDEATMFDHISQLHQTSPFSGWQPVYSREEAQQGFANHILAQYERPDFYRWCICMGEQFVGNITLTMLSDTSLLAELGYTINAAERASPPKQPERSSTLRLAPSASTASRQPVPWKMSLPAQC